MTLPIIQEDHPSIPANPSPRDRLGNPERLPSQKAEDWLFAYVTARSCAARESMLPHLVESVEELIAAFQCMYDHKSDKRCE